MDQQCISPINELKSNTFHEKIRFNYLPPITKEESNEEIKIEDEMVKGHKIISNNNFKQIKILDFNTYNEFEEGHSLNNKRLQFESASPTALVCLKRSQIPMAAHLDQFLKVQKFI